MAVVGDGGVVDAVVVDAWLLLFAVALFQA